MTRSDEKSAFSAVRASFLSALVERVEATGRSAQPLLNHLGLTHAQLSDPYGAIPLPLFVDFLETAARQTQDEALGARIGSQLRATDMGPVGIILSLSASIDIGLSRLARYANALQGGNVSQWIADGEHFVFSYRITDRAIWPRKQDAEFSLSILTQALRDNFFSRFAPVEVHFEHMAPANREPLERLFRAPVHFGRPTNRMIIRDQDASRVLRVENRELLATLERHVSDLIAPDRGQWSREPKNTTTDHARAVIDACLGLSPITLDRVAQALRVTPRTLQRRLHAEGTGLRRLLDRARQDRAAELLAQPGAQVAQVALALGYTDPTAFWRAHRGWTGLPPTASRRPPG